MRRLSLFLGLLALGCSAGTPPGNMMMAADLALPSQADLARPPAGALGPLMPQVIQVEPTNSVLTSPKIVAITWDNDPRRADIEGFVANFAQSSAWAAETAEYGVGALTVGTPQHIAGDAPPTMNGAYVEARLKQNLGGAWGAADANTIYGFFIPPTTVFDDGGGYKCCVDIDGYHYDLVVNGPDVPYFIACSCPGFDGPSIDDLQQLTVVASHEMVEAATDPLQAGFAETDDAHAVWTYANDGEVADLCVYTDTAYWQPADMTYMIQRSWSNQAAAAGTDPCVGDPQALYYQTVPDQPDAITIDLGFGPWDTQGLRIPVGQTAMVSLHVYGDAAAGPFEISLHDNLESFGLPPVLELATPPVMANAGDDVQMSIKVLAQDPGLGSGEAFYVTTKPLGGGGGPSTYFYGLVGQ